MPKDNPTPQPAHAGPLDAVLAEEMQHLRDRLAALQAGKNSGSETERDLQARLETLQRGREAVEHTPLSPATKPETKKPSEGS